MNCVQTEGTHTHTDTDTDTHTHTHRHTHTHKHTHTQTQTQTQTHTDTHRHTDTHTDTRSPELSACPIVPTSMRCEGFPVWNVTVMCWLIMRRRKLYLCSCTKPSRSSHE